VPQRLGGSHSLQPAMRGGWALGLALLKLRKKVAIQVPFLEREHASGSQHFESLYICVCVWARKAFENHPTMTCFEL